MKSLSYTDRIPYCSNPVAKNLLKIMDEKKTNLCFNPDVTKSSELLRLTKLVAPYICTLKTHIDVLEDFTPSVTNELKKLAKEHNFLIFEDRKFADIGNTVKLQYEKGVYQIANWADITNAHVVAGPGTIKGLEAIGKPKQRALLLLAEMSSEGNLATGSYTKNALKMAEDHSDFCIGFIAMKKISDDPKFLHLTPGVKKEIGTDKLGQKYKTPRSVIFENQSDVIIVGRGIYQAEDPAKEAKEFAKLGFNAYLERLS